MMKTATNKSIIDDLNDCLSPEDSIMAALAPQEFSESSSQGRTSKKAEKKLNINNSILLDIITDQTRAKFVWQCVSGFMGICIVAAVFMYFNLYKTTEILNERLTGITKLETKLAESKSEAEQLKADVLQSKTEFKYAQNELSNSKTEIAKLQQELETVNGQLKNLQDRNAEVVKILNGRLQKLSTQTDPKR